MSKRKVITSIFIITAALLFFLVGSISQNYLVPIIMYHSVNPQAESSNRLAVTEETFKSHMDFFKKHQYNVLPLESLATLIKDRKKIPPRTISITFDDGYKDNFTYAFPILKKYNMPATIFIIVNEVGRPDRLSWDEIKTMQDEGLITFSSHTMGPVPLTDIKSEEELKRQIFDSKRILEEKLGRNVTALSYPEGRFNDQIKQLVIDAGYGFAVTTNPGKRFCDDDIFALKRLRISSTANSLFVFWIETSGYYNFIREHRHK